MATFLIPAVLSSSGFIPNKWMHQSITGDNPLATYSMRLIIKSISHPCSWSSCHTAFISGEPMVRSWGISYMCCALCLRVEPEIELIIGGTPLSICAFDTIYCMLQNICRKPHLTAPLSALANSRTVDHILIRLVVRINVRCSPSSPSALAHRNIILLQYLFNPHLQKTSPLQISHQPYRPSLSALNLHSLYVWLILNHQCTHFSSLIAFLTSPLNTNPSILWLPILSTR